jgi:putative acetyltransferase
MINSGPGFSPLSALVAGGSNSASTAMSHDVLIEPLGAGSEELAADLIRRNLLGYEEAGTVLGATYRRLADFKTVYTAPGAVFFVARDVRRDGLCIGGAGLGSLHGLPPSEGLGEIRDLVVEASHRGQGVGARLLKRCVEEAVKFGYQRLYLETTPQMEHAQKLFIRFGFRPVTQAQESKGAAEKMAGYYILENLGGKKS